MENSNKTIVWFRRDLRIEDNPALSAAAQEGLVFPVFIWCPREEGQFYPGRVSRWWLKQSLTHLEQSLKSLGAQLILMKTSSTLTALLECVEATGATKVVYNHLYDPVSLVRDHDIKEKLVEKGICVQSYNADLLYEPWEIYDEKGIAFTSFDAYWNKCLNMQVEPVSHGTPRRLLLALGTVGSCLIDELGLEHETEKSSNALLGRAWLPGWSSADKVLTEFLEHHLIHYGENRAKVGGSSTSLLSPYLHFGEISVRKIFQNTQMKQIMWAREGETNAQESATLFLKSIGLREYSRYLCFNFPFTHERALLSHLTFFPWRADQGHFKAWRQGRTGYPLVDAGMRELWATGWIHNRIRVIVSSFAVKFLLLPWKWGMKYFWDTLLDADLESDILGWQYISGSLPDGHELERMDCPEVQGLRFDPQGDYVRQWLPELARMPTEWIHHPWDGPPHVLKAAGVELGSNYPKPIVDLDTARTNLTEAIFKMWESEATARATDRSGTSEVVGDNSDTHQSENMYKVIANEKTTPPGPAPTVSSNDQKVPSVHNLECHAVPRKRTMEAAMDRRLTYRVEEDVCSTAESSSASKKQATMSRNSFSVPHSYCSESSSIGRPLEELELESLEPNQEELELELGKTCLDKDLS
ncbi:hypothetical protein SAY87_014898 [Trapa incisa]|uniref:Photolyase/cryptochrome alpha/beta domain-containing protein n=1 Tax=Trapa incisa TaxID=236973 RepID=A0AAN7JL14_9MYRT|nr:hypothetical protein SAY87_014898 [Trapa incisa]